MSMSIPLTRGMTAVVDVADYDLVSGMKWHAQQGKNDCFYAAKKAQGGSVIFMHRLILDAKKGELVDHRDWDGLNNRRQNIRKVTRSQNGHNRQHAKGYSWDKPTKQWRAEICVNWKKLHLGYFPTAALARAAYLNAKKEYGYVNDDSLPHSRQGRRTDADLPGISTRHEGRCVHRGRGHSARRHAQRESVD